MPFQLCAQNYGFCEWVKFGAISYSCSNLKFLMHICDTYNIIVYNLPH